MIYSTIVSVLSISLTFVKSGLSDATEISFQKMLSLQWLWQNRLFLIATVLVAIPWLACSFMAAQISKEMTLGSQTASMLTLTPGIIGPVIFFVQFYLFQLYRHEALPTLGFNRFWIDIVLLAVISGGSSYITYDAIMRLGIRSP